MVGPAPHPPKGHNPQFSAHVCCGQMDRWMKMPLGTEVPVGLGPGHIVLDGDPVPLPRKSTTPIFAAHVYCGQMITHLRCCWALALISVSIPVPGMSEASQFDTFDTYIFNHGNW